MFKTIKNQLPTIVAVLFTIIILAGTLFWFNGSIDGLIENTTRSYLTENAKAVAAVFNTKLDDQLVMLESQVRYFSDIDLTDYNAMKSTIMSTKGIGAFKTIGVANSAGTTINYNGMSSGNILLEPYFKEAMTGVNAISDTTTVDEEGDFLGRGVLNREFPFNVVAVRVVLTTTTATTTDLQDGVFLLEFIDDFTEGVSVAGDVVHHPFLQTDVTHRGEGTYLLPAHNLNGLFVTGIGTGDETLHKVVLDGVLDGVLSFRNECHNV